jgi:hypothetical protein
MARKKTSADVSAVASRILATDNPLDAYRGKIAVAIQECGLPLNERAVAVFVDRISDALAPMIADMRTLAGSALSQDEEPAVKSGFDAGDEELAGN